MAGKPIREFRETTTMVKTILDNLRAGDEVSPNVLIGPVVRDPVKDDEWYFLVGGGDKNGVRGDRIVSAEEDHAVEIREVLLLVMALLPTGMTVHLFDDELDLANMAVELWPSDTTRKVRDGIQRERRQRMH